MLPWRARAGKRGCRRSLSTCLPPGATTSAAGKTICNAMIALIAFSPLELHACYQSSTHPVARFNPRRYSGVLRSHSGERIGRVFLYQRRWTKSQKRFVCLPTFQMQSNQRLACAHSQAVRRGLLFPSAARHGCACVFPAGEVSKSGTLHVAVVLADG
jgi:hypothetical protein